MDILRVVSSICVVVTILGSPNAGSAETDTLPVRSSIPYVATRSDSVRDMLWMANVGKNDVVYDLGSGDGRIVISAIRDFGARRAVGIEMDSNLIRESRENARKAGVTDRVEFIQGNLFTNDLRQASVVTLFLGHEPNITLRPKMFNMLEPGTRIISHQFGMGEWQADKALAVRRTYMGMYGTLYNPYSHNPHVPDYSGNESDPFTNDKILMWVVPAPVAGVWRGRIETAQGLQDCQLVLHQYLSKVIGTIQISAQGDPEGLALVELWGKHVRFASKLSHGQFQLRFDGHVLENTMQGTLAVTNHGQLREGAWEVKRDKADFTGMWEWPCAVGPRSVKLHIEQRDGHPIATYIDQDHRMHVTDFYDCGGGFYFTMMIGREGPSTRITDDTGWLIGEAVVEQGALAGTIKFYPWEGKPIERKDWAPRLKQP